MKTLRGYLATEILAATALVMAALVMLFAFFDLVEQIKDLGRGAYTLRRIGYFVLLMVPDHVYELAPIAALIGTLFALAQLVAGSEYTVMRTSGVSTARFAGALALIGLVLALVTFLVGEFIAPPAERFAQRLRSQAITGLVAQEFRTGLWVKDDRSFVNVGEVTPGSALKGVRIYRFDGEHRLLSISLAASGDYRGEHRWRLTDITRTEFTDMKTTVARIGELEWESVLDPSLLATLMQRPEKMSAWRLYTYAQHLKENRQKALRYEIALWSKATYPLAVLVMMVIALPFAQISQRGGGVGAKVFAGIMLGLAFHFLNRLFSHLGLLNDWLPVVAASVPTLLFLSVAIGMLWWQERR
ncbi:MAG: LPS export ABC transporter permease LptG [Burkholderiales bacterium]|nr:LPS export ABC transporter permease LptG [Burkholderiales bacterium]